MGRSADYIPIIYPVNVFVPVEMSSSDALNLVFIETMICSLKTSTAGACLLFNQHAWLDQGHRRLPTGTDMPHYRLGVASLRSVRSIHAHRPTTLYWLIPQQSE